MAFAAADDDQVGAAFARSAQALGLDVAGLDEEVRIAEAEVVGQVGEPLLGALQQFFLDLHGRHQRLAHRFDRHELEHVQQVDAGADWIKMYGSTGTYANVTGRQTFTDAEMRIAVEAAHRFGRKIAIHSYGEPGGRAAMRAGADAVEHPAGLEAATIAEWARTSTYYVPTIDHNRFYAENAPLLGYNAEQVAGLDSFRLLNLESARRAFKAGVKFAMGSDAVWWMFGENTRELGWFVKAGMTPAQALATATSGGASLLGMSDRLGNIAPGYFADIVAVSGDPLDDIGVVINNVRWVMKGGAVVVDKR